MEKKRKFPIEIEIVKSKRPLALDLIILYIILQFIFVIFSIVAGYGGIIGVGAILMVFGLYYGLWKMRKDWMWIVVILLSITTAFYIFYSIIGALNIIGVTIVVLNVLSIYWLYAHRNLFIEPEKGKSALGTKKEWIIIGIIILGIIIFFILLFSFSGVFG